VPNARATRTRSRAAPGASPTRQLSHSAHEAKPRIPPAAGVELADEKEQAGGGGVQMGGQLGDLVAQAIQLVDMRGILQQRERRGGHE
jgi:hypothetical protein